MPTFNSRLAPSSSSPPSELSGTAAPPRSWRRRGASSGDSSRGGSVARSAARISSSSGSALRATGPRRARVVRAAFCRTGSDPRTMSSSRGSNGWAASPSPSITRNTSDPRLRSKRSTSWQSSDISPAAAGPSLATHRHQALARSGSVCSRVSLRAATTWGSRGEFQWASSSAQGAPSGGSANSRSSSSGSSCSVGTPSLNWHQVAWTNWRGPAEAKVSATLGARSWTGGPIAARAPRIASSPPNRSSGLAVGNSSNSGKTASPWLTPAMATAGLGLRMLTGNWRIEPVRE